MSVKMQGISASQKVAGVVTEYLNPEKSKESEIQAIVQRLFEEPQKTWSIIFLKINGVLLTQMGIPEYSERVDKKLGEMFKKTLIEKTPRGEHWGYTQFQHLCAASHFFHPPAVERLQGLIDEAGKAARVGVVISCNVWGSPWTVEELKHRIFTPHKFSANILDKTGKQASEIEVWLRKNRVRLDIGSFVILSLKDGDLGPKFPRNFLEMKKPIFNSSNQDDALEILTGQKRDVAQSAGNSLQPSRNQKRAESKRQTSRP